MADGDSAISCPLGQDRTFRETRRRIDALDLFCGAAGGWSLGLHRAGVRTVAACEIDEWRRETYARNNPGVRMYGDVRELTAARLMADLGHLPDWIVGSPPCQDASLANSGGEGAGGDRTGLFFEAIRIIDECRPRWAILENVAGLRTRGADRVLSALESIGYTCWPLVVGACHAGAPHKRNRVWIVAADTTRWSARPGSDIAFAESGGSHSANAFGQCGNTAIGEGERCDALEELPSAVRAIGKAWRAWGKPLARHLRMDDGLSAGLARKCISAYGDAVLPQITEAIARSILSLDGALIEGLRVHRHG